MSKEKGDLFKRIENEGTKSQKPSEQYTENKWLYELSYEDIVKLALETYPNEETPFQFEKSIWMFQKQQWKQHVHTERTGGWKGNKYIELLTEEDWKDFYDKDNLWKVFCEIKGIDNE